MANAVSELLIKIKAEVNDTLAKFGLVGKSIENVSDQSEKASKAAEKSASSISKLGNANNQISSLGTAINNAKNALIGFFAVSQVTSFVKDTLRVADSYNLLQARIKLATNSVEEYNSAQASLNAIANETGTAYGDIGNLFAKTNQAVKELGLSQQDTLDFVKLVGQAGKVSGASAENQAAGIQQLTQALQSGVLRGDEFNSVMENTPRLAQALADGLGVARGELRGLAEDGKLSSDLVLQALLSQKNAVEGEFKGIPDTISKIVTEISNEWNKGIGELDDAGNLSQSITSNLGFIKDFVKEITGSLKTNSGDIKEEIEGIGKASIIISNAIKVVFNELNLGFNGLRFLVANAAAEWTSFFSSITSGDTSKTLAEISQSFRNVTDDIAKNVETDSKDIVNAWDNFAKAFDQNPAEAKVIIKTESIDQVFQDAAKKVNENLGLLQKEIEKNPIDLKQKQTNQDAQKQAAANLKKMQSEAAQLYDQTRTPLEQLNAEQARYKQLLDNNLITQDTYNRALLASQEAVLGLKSANEELSSAEAFRLQQEAESLRIKQEQARLDAQNPFQNKTTAQDGALVDVPTLDPNQKPVEIPIEPKLDPEQFTQQAQAAITDIPPFKLSVVIDNDALIASLNAAIANAQANVTPIIIPVVYAEQTGTDSSIDFAALAGGKR